MSDEDTSDSEEENNPQLLILRIPNRSSSINTGNFKFI
jgi:hypothetical protein